MPRRVLINAISLTYQGGGRNYVRNLTREFASDPRGFEVAVLCARGRLGEDEASGLERVEVALPEGVGRLGTLARVGYEEALLPFRSRAFDLLYCVADLAPRVPSVPTVVALRNLNIYDRRFYDTARTRLLFRLVRAGVRHASAVVCPTSAAAADIGPTVGIDPQRIRVIHHGIDRAAFDATAGQERSNRDEPPYLFLPANLERHKNIPLLFEALPKVRDPDLELWIAGGDHLDPEWAARLHELARTSGVAGRVRFLGSVPYAEVLDYYRGARALAFPSLIETFGHPLLEAMLAETGIAAADLASFREVAGDVALYFPTDDASAAASAIEEAASEGPARTARIEAGRERVGHFTWKRSVDALARVFDEVLSPGTVTG